MAQTEGTATDPLDIFNNGTFHFNRVIFWGNGAKCFGKSKLKYSNANKHVSVFKCNYLQLLTSGTCTTDYRP